MKLLAQKECNWKLSYLVWHVQIFPDVFFLVQIFSMSSEAVGNPSTECKVDAFAVLKIKKHFRDRHVRNNLLLVAYCYHLVNVIPLYQPQSDNFKWLPLYQVTYLDKSEGMAFHKDMFSWFFNWTKHFPLQMVLKTLNAMNIFWIQLIQTTVFSKVFVFVLWIISMRETVSSNKN